MKCFFEELVTFEKKLFEKSKHVFHTTAFYPYEIFNYFPSLVKTLNCPKSYAIPSHKQRLKTSIASQ